MTRSTRRFVPLARGHLSTDSLILICHACRGCLPSSCSFGWTSKVVTSRDLHLEITKYAFECGEAVILGVENGGPKRDRFMQLFEETFKGLGYVLPLDIPGFPFHQCMKAREALVQEFQDLIEKKRKNSRIHAGCFKSTPCWTRCCGLDASNDLV